MKKNKNNKILSVIWMATYIFMVLGATFSYFTSFRQSETGSVTSTAAIVRANLNITAIQNSKLLIPMNDDDYMKAYENECVDIHGYGACQLYNIELENINTTMAYTGTITFTLNEIEHLKYLLLDENDEVYLDKTDIIPGEPQTMGDEFTLNAGESKNLKLLIWVPNYNYDQNDEDSNGYFSASVSYESTYGSRITGSISG